MNILYASVQCSEKKYKELFENAKIKPGQQVQKYNRLLAEGLSMQKGVYVTAITAPPLVQGSFEKRFLKSGKEKVSGIDYNYLPVVNIHRIADLLIVVSSFLISVYWGIKKKKAKYICDILNAPVALGALMASKLLRRRCVGIVTDLPDLVYRQRDKAYRFTSNYILFHCTDYVFLTQQMNDLLNPNNRPYTVIEGIADGRDVSRELANHKHGVKVCMYTGTLDQKYGIGVLLDAFVDANVDNAELHIYGDGDYLSKVLEKAKKYPSIRYFGVQLNTTVIEEQRRATVLINPRPSNEEFTKYSFPSKNIEYMSSGTPVLTTKLPGIPDEYNKYVYLIEDESKQGFQKSLEFVLGKDSEELNRKGQEARQFVLQEKNKSRQALKIIELFS